MVADMEIPAKKSTFIRCGEITAVVVVITVVWGLAFLPAVFYFLPQSTNEQVNVTNFNHTNSSSCTAEAYLGNMCRDELLFYQGCVAHTDGSKDINIPSSGNQEETEEQVRQLLLGLQLLDPSPECMQGAKSLLCLYLFGLCSSSGDVILPASEQCEAVRSDVCVMEWQRATAFLGMNQLPQCESLSEPFIDCSGNVGSAEGGSTLPPVTEHNISDPREESNNTNSTTVCSEDFYLDLGVCKPQCGEWLRHPHNTVVTFQILVGVTTSFGLTAATLVLIVSCIRYKKVFKFPSVFIVYQTITLYVLGVFILIGYTDRDGLFCNSPSTLESLENPSTFCTITGVVFVYTIMQLALWWLLHIIVIFSGITFPFKARSIRAAGRCRYVHVVMVTIGLIVPCVPVAVSFVRRGYGSVSPTFLCTPRDGAASFYTLVLPISVFLATGISMLVIMFVGITKVASYSLISVWPHSLEQHRICLFCFSLQVSGLQRKAKAVEVRVLIILCYFILLGVSALTTFSVSSQNIQHFTRELISYFLCESTGITNGKLLCDRMAFEQFSNPIPTALSFLLLGLYPVVNLIYVVHIQELKQKGKKLTHKLSRHSSYLNSSNKVELHKRSV